MIIQGRFNAPASFVRLPARGRSDPIFTIQNKSYIKHARSRHKVFPTHQGVFINKRTQQPATVLTTLVAATTSQPIIHMSADGGLSRKPEDKRKKRRRKKKRLPPDAKLAMPTTTDTSEPTEVPQSLPDAVKRLEKTVLPRRQTLMRYKTSDDELRGQSPILAAKDKLRKPLIASESSIVPPVITTDASGALDTTQTPLNMDDKVTLFKYKLLKILVYDELPDDPKLLLGRLLSHGAIEIFQLHNGDVTYLACGLSLVYPLLPKLKVLRIAFAQFIVPLAYPERYWKIFINSDEPHVVQVLENTFELVVRYRNLYKHEASPPQPEAGSLPLLDIDTQPTELKALSIEDGDLPPFEIASELPPLPPLAPLSPHALVAAPWTGVSHKVSEQLISTAIACLDMTKPLKKEDVSRISHRNSLGQALAIAPFDHATLAPPFKGPNLSHVTNGVGQNSNWNPPQAPPNQPSYTRHSNPFSRTDHRPLTRVVDVDEKLDLSMDLLLDEYEESICHTRSVAHLLAAYLRQPLRRNLITLGKRSLYYRPKEREDFPSTLLSEYNRIHNGGGHLIRSRRSLRLEFHPAREDWLDHHQRLPKTRSNYSINSALSDINSTYRYIYKLIAQRNLRNNDDDRLSRKVPPTPPIPPEYLVGRNAGISRKGSQYSGLDTPAPLVPPRTPARPPPDYKLNLLEIYLLISNTSSKNKSRGPSPNKSFTQRLFGW